MSNLKLLFSANNTQAICDVHGEKDDTSFIVDDVDKFSELDNKGLKTISSIREELQKTYPEMTEAELSWYAHRIFSGLYEQMKSLILAPTREKKTTKL